tara:strand:+ start:141 stop:341 length:201 start_codon:yes stop_codon:yes gene_type:complete
MYYDVVLRNEEKEQDEHEAAIRRHRARREARESHLRAELDAELERIDRELALIGFQNSQEFAQVPR